MKNILIISGFVIVFLLSSCDNPDFARYRFYQKQVQIKIEGDVFVISNIEEEMLNIAQQYCKEVALTKVEYILSDESNGTVYLHYSSIYDDRTTNVWLEIDISERVVSEITFDDGHSKRVSSPGRYVDNTNYDVRDIFYETVSDLKEKGFNPEKILHITVTFINKNVRVNSYDVWNRPINGYYYPHSSE